jgi:hypothetical protein
MGKNVIWTINQMHQASTKPQINMITLKLLLDYYEHSLMPYEFQYTLRNNIPIRLHFNDENFCHLFGIKTIAKKTRVSGSKLEQYRGRSGFLEVKDNVRDFDDLKKLNEKWFRSLRLKYLFFNFIPHLVDSPHVLMQFKPGQNIAVKTVGKRVR